jgi:LysM repeat protein
MPQQIRIDETIAERTVDTEVVKNVSVPSRLPPAERVVSVNARVEITEVNVNYGNVVYSGIIRSSIYYAPAEEDSNVVSIRRNFQFTEKVNISRARPGYDVTVDSVITDIDFNIINERLLGVEYVITSDIEVTAPERVEFVEEREDVELRRQMVRIRRKLREREFTRELISTERIPGQKPDIKRIVNVDADIQIISIDTGEDRVFVTGVVNNNVLYQTDRGDIEYVTLEFPFEESFFIRGVSTDMAPFIEENIIKIETTKVDDRRIRKNVTTRFNVLVLTEEEVSIPIDIISPEQLFPVRRSVIVEKVVAEERIRVLARGTTQIQEGNPDIDRVIKATGRLRGELDAFTEEGGISLDGVVVANIIYVADLSNQPVYFTTATIPFSYFADIPEVSPGMNVVVEAKVTKTTAEKVSDRSVRVRATIEVNILITERVRVSVVTGISERPTQEEPVTEQPGGFRTYTVRSGDTLYLISRRYNVSINRLIELNNITNPNQLRVGQQLLIPKK